MVTQSVSEYRRRNASSTTASVTVRRMTTSGSDILRSAAAQDNRRPKWLPCCDSSPTRPVGKHSSHYLRHRCRSRKRFSCGFRDAVAQSPATRSLANASGDPRFGPLTPPELPESETADDLDTFGSADSSRRCRPECPCGWCLRAIRDARGRAARDRPRSD